MDASKIQLIEATGFKAMLGGSLSTIFAGLAAIPWATVVGIVVAIGGLCMQAGAWIMKREKHKIEMQILRKQLEDLDK